jgi:hypothetical protein
MPTRRTVLQMSALATLGVAGAGIGTANAATTVVGTLAPQNTPVPYVGIFRRPPELTPYETALDDGDPNRPFERFAVTAQLGLAHILPGGLPTTIAGYNGLSPGPTIRARQGTRTELRIRNGFPGAGLLLPQAIDISTHLHGSESLPQYDGYANDITVPGFVKNYHYPNAQRAHTLWYHDHRHLVTAQNVYSGLAAFFPLSDAFERAQLPQGEYDVPLMLSDALFNADGSLAYNDDDTKGLWGDIILVNGVPPSPRAPRRSRPSRCCAGPCGRPAGTAWTCRATRSPPCSSTTSGSPSGPPTPARCRGPSTAKASWPTPWGTTRRDSGPVVSTSSTPARCSATPCSGRYDAASRARPGSLPERSPSPPGPPTATAYASPTSRHRPPTTSPSRRTRTTTTR